MAVFEFMQVGYNYWNSNFLKWATGLIGSNDQSKQTKSTAVVSFQLIS